MSEADYERVVVSHYKKPEVQREIARFSHNRWMAIHCESVNPQGYQVLLRYQRDAGGSKVPLTVANPQDVPTLLRRFERLRPRAFYASINVYKNLSHQESITDLSNIISCDPTWDIDGSLEKWKATVEAAKAIVTLLEKEGISKSVFLKWSGNGAHVHLNNEALSPSLAQKIAPLDAAYAMAEYVNGKLKAEFKRIRDAHGANELNIENEIDIQRLFTSPLSLHRSLNRVAVCLPTNRMEDFTPEWTQIEGYQHWTGWDQFEVGEADALAEKAYGSVGGYKVKAQIKVKSKGAAMDSLDKWLKKDRSD